MNCNYDTCAQQLVGNNNIHIILQVLISSFFAITFIQSGWDKVDDKKGNLSWLINHFSKTIFKNAIPVLLFVITMMELLAGFLSVAGIIVLLYKQCDYWMFWANLISAITLLFLFMGQRVAKDYAGAQSLIGYFLLALLGLYLNS